MATRDVGGTAVSPLDSVVGSSGLQQLLEKSFPPQKYISIGIGPEKHKMLILQDKIY